MLQVPSLGRSILLLWPNTDKRQLKGSPDLGSGLGVWSIQEGTHGSRTVREAAGLCLCLSGQEDRTGSRAES